MKREDLSLPYSIELFTNLNKEVIKSDFKKSDLTVIHIDKSKFICQANYLGVYDDLDLHVFAVQHKSSNDARVGIGLEIFKIMKNNNFQNSIVASYNDNDNEWRYSLITSSLEIDERGKIVKNFSTPKRYSYVLGPSAKTLTPYNQLIKKGGADDLDKIKEIFSVEVVNNKFYNQIAELYDQLVGTDKQQRLLKYPNSTEQSHEFATRLIGRLIFCWFLKEKRRTDGTSLIPEIILSEKAAKVKNYYHEILAPLFFEVLNKESEYRSSKFTKNGFEKIPYLNGGLFRAIDEVDYYKFDKELQISVAGLVDVPDTWLIKFIELLETYNFTVDENTSYDNDLSIDPEMLGRVFENLLARINPETGQTVRNSTGSFYTPREVVDYMVDTSLIHYLQIKTNVNKDKLDALISYDLLDDVGQELNKLETEEVLEALSELTVLDPACGSGAYPIGVLQKILHVVNIIDPKGVWWLEKQLGSADPELKRELEGKGLNYIRKLNIINKSIFGVDIQPIATEISRLRCFLTLVVDEEISEFDRNQGVRPLPNLDFKFVTADTLIKSPSTNEDNKPRLLDSFEDELANLVSNYFSSQGEERTNLSHRLRDLISNKVRENNMLVLNNRGIIRDERFQDESNKRNQPTSDKLIKEAALWDSYNNIFNYKKVEFFDTKYFFPQAKNGFDIVIGNPPYIQLQKDGGLLADKYKDCGYDTFARTGDIYALFYERGLELTKESTGLLCYITSNKWMRAGYGKQLRQFMAEHNPIELIDLGGEVFETATVDTNIILINNSKSFSFLKALDLSTVKNIPSFNNYKNDWVNIDEFNSDAWFIGSKIEFNIMKKIERIGKPLKDWDLKINRGILTGYNEAFIIDNATKEMLCKADPHSLDIIKPILRGRDISRYSANWAGLWLINSHNGYGEKPAVNVKRDYPAIYKHLQNYKEKLRTRRDKGNNWFNLRNCAYLNEFGKEKIIWGNIAYNSSFTFDKNNFVNAPANLLTAKGVNIKFLLGLMNSKIFSWEFSSLGITLGKAFEWKKQYVEQIHIPMADENSQKDIVELVDKVLDITTAANYNPEELPASQIEYEKAIDKIVYKLYGLNAEEIELLEKPSRP